MAPLDLTLSGLESQIKVHANFGGLICCKRSMLRHMLLLNANRQRMSGV